MTKCVNVKIINNERGVALITVILLGSIAMGLVGVAYHLGTVNAFSSGKSSSYSSELNVSKGVSDYVMARMTNMSLTCSGGAVCVADADGDPTPGNCDAASQIDISAAVCNALGKPGCANISACLLSSTVSGGWTYAAVNVQADTQASAATPGRGERAIVDFVFRYQ